MKIVNLILALLFAVFAFWQFNDPDPWAWASLYAYVAISLGMAAFGMYRPWAALLGIGLCIVWMAFILPEFINWVKMGMPSITGQMKTEEPHIEFTREFLGLLLSGLALFWVWRQGKREHTEENPSAEIDTLD